MNLSRNLRLLIVFLSYLFLLFVVALVIDKFYFPSLTSGKKSVSVPNVVRKKFDEAKQILEDSDLYIEVAKEIYNEKLPAGHIIAQVPVANSEVKSDRLIFVTISKGKELVAVPYVVGLTQRTARINLMKVGLEIGNITYDFSDEVGKDTIISQKRKVGAKIPYGESVNIVVSKGTENPIRIPHLVGLTYVEALQLLKESDLILGKVEFQADATFLPDVVIMQSPQAGETASPGAVVNLSIVK